MEKLKSDDRFTVLIDAAVDGIFIINSDGIIEVANQAVENMLGYNLAEIIGQNINVLMPSPHRAQHDGYLQH